MRINFIVFKTVVLLLFPGIITIPELFACNAPTNFTVSNILQESAVLSWDQEGAADDWTVIYGPIGFIPAAAGTAVFGITENTYTLTGLSPNTTYQVYIRSNCNGTGGNSILVGPLSFTTLITCPAPTNVSLVTISDSSATFFWSQPGQTELWEIEYGHWAFSQGAGTILTGITEKPYTLNGLSYGTNYQIFIRTLCGAETSSWSPVYGFTTNCITLIPDFLEDFNVPSLPAKCWSLRSGQLTVNSTLSYSNRWFIDGFANIGTTGAARINIYGTSLYGWLISPSINLGDGTVSYMLEFDVALTSQYLTTNPQLSGTDDIFAIIISTNNGLTWSSANILRKWDNQGSAHVYNELNPQGEHVIVDLSSYSGIVKIGFYGQSTVSNANNDLFIDNVAVNAEPECMAPENVVAYGATETSVVVSWSDVVTTTEWDVIYGEVGFDPEISGNFISGIVANPFTLEGLDDGKTYDIYIKAHCAGSYNHWTGPAQITTIPYCLTPDGLTFSEISAYSVNLGWHETGTATQWDIAYGQSGFDPSNEGALITGLSSTDYTIEGLLPQTEYDIYARSDCGEHLSNWSEKLNIFTSCDNSSALPASESFESEPGYFINDFANNVDWDIVSSVSTDGSNCVRNHFSANNSNSLILHCPIDFSTVVNPVLTFSQIPLTRSNIDHCYVELSTDGFTWTILPANRYLGSGNYHIPTQNNPEGPCFDMSSYYTSFSTPLTNVYWRNEKFSLSDYSGQSEVWLRFRVNSLNLANYPGWYIDNIKIFDETCPSVTGLETGLVESSFAELMWENNSLALSWKVIYGIHGFNPVEEGSELNVDVNTVIITDLNPETHYDVYVMANCADNEQSSMAEPLIVVTPEQCITPTGLSVSNIAKTHASVNWISPDANSWKIIYGESPCNPETEGTLLTEILETPYELEDLAPGTQYDVRVKADCETDGESQWSDIYQFTTLPACLVPVSFTVSDVTVNTAIVSCAIEPDATGWAVLYGFAGFNPYTDGNIVSGINTTEYTITDLEPHTSYDIYCRCICGSSFSDWSEKIEISTTCDASFSLPLIETFENGVGAFVNAGSNGANWSIDSNLAFEGQYCIKNQYTNSDNNILELRCPVDLSNTQHPYLSFASMALTEKNYDYCYVEVSTNGTDWSFLSTSRYLGTGLYQEASLYMQYQSEGPCFMESSYPGWLNATPDNNLWKVETFNLSSYVGEPELWIRFRLSSDASVIKNGWFLDKIMIYDETCKQPSNLTLINSSGHSALIGWIEEGTAAEWELTYGMQGFYPVESGTLITSTENQYNITGLSPETNYEVYVRSDCSGDDKSLWTVPLSFTSNVPCTAVAGTTFVNSDYQSITLEINQLGIETNWNVLYGPANFVAGEGTQISVDNNTFTVSGLNYSTEYDFYILANCGSDGFSQWAGPFTYATTVLCPHIEVIEVLDITYDGFRFEIEPGSTETQWDIIYGKSNDPSSPGTLIAGNTNNPVTITGLEPETQYSVYIRANCPNLLGTSELAGPFQITTMPSCPEVTNITASDVQCNSALISWTDDLNETQWTIEIGEQGFTQGTGTVETISSPHIQLANLSINTFYTIYIKANCGGLLGDSDWQPFHFKTDCDTISELPFTEEFTDWAAITQCWNLTGGTQTILHYNNSAIRANFWSWTDGNTAYLSSPLIDKSSLVNPRIEFMWSHMAYPSLYPNDKLELQVSDDNGETWTNVWVKSGSAFGSGDGAGYTTPGSYISSGSVLLDNFGDYIKFRFKFTSGYGPDVFIDKVMIYDIFCEPVAEIALADVSHDFAHITWSNSGSNGVNIHYGPHGFNPEAEGAVIHNISPNTYFYYLFGLTPNTTYDVYIEALCSDSHSALGNPLTFTTVAYSTETDILEFSFVEYDVDSNTIDYVEKTVTAQVMYGTDLSNLVAIFNLSQGACAYVNGIQQFSYTTPNNFNQPVIYNVVAEDGTHQTDWTVFVQILSQTNVETASCLKVYPNPATENIWIYEQRLVPERITLVSSDGRTVYSNNYCSQTTQIPLLGLEPGSYLLKIELPDGNIVWRKFIKL